MEVADIGLETDIEKTVKVSLLRGLEELPDCLLEKVLNFLKELNDHYEK